MGLESGGSSECCEFSHSKGLLKCWYNTEWAGFHTQSTLLAIKCLCANAQQKNSASKSLKFIPSSPVVSISFMYRAKYVVLPAVVWSIMGWG